MRCLKTLKTLAIVAGFVLLLLSGEAVAQYGPRPIPFRPPPSMSSGASDLLPFLLGVMLFMTVLIGIIGCVLLPVLGKAMGLKPRLGACCGLATPLAGVVLYLVWQPLHLTTICRWACAGGMVLLIVGILVAIVGGLFRGAYSLYCTNNSPDTDSSQGFFIVVSIGIGTAILHITMKWGFWLSLLGGVGGFLAVSLVIATCMEMVKWAIKK